MTSEVMNRPVLRESLQNEPNALLRGSFGVVNSHIRLSDEVLDEVLIARAIQVRAVTPLTTYKTLEDLMREHGD